MKKRRHEQEKIIKKKRMKDKEDKEGRKVKRRTKGGKR